MSILRIGLKMKLRNKPVPAYYATITTDVLKKCLFRFLKEFDLYHAYKVGMKEKINIEKLVRINIYFKLVGNFTLDDIFKAAPHPHHKCLFPSEDSWVEVLELWREWAENVDNISRYTIII